MLGCLESQYSRRSGVPSARQKASVSSLSTWRHFGQRFIFAPAAAAAARSPHVPAAASCAVWVSSGHVGES